MNSSVNAVSNGSASGIGNRLMGLQPPLSPPTSSAPVAVAPTSVPVAAPAPVAAAAPAPAPSPAPSTENLLVRFGLLATEQVEEALQDQRGSGKHVAQIAVERGWVTREQLAQLVTQTPPPPAEPVPAPPPPPPAAEAAAPDLEPAPEPAPAPAQPEPTVAIVARVWARLSTGERVEVASFADLHEARARAEQVVRELSADRPAWPCFSGRFVRPEAIVSLDVEATLG